MISASKCIKSNQSSCSHKSPLDIKHSINNKQWVHSLSLRLVIENHDVKESCHQVCNLALHLFALTSFQKPLLFFLPNILPHFLPLIIKLPWFLENGWLLAPMLTPRYTRKQTDFLHPIFSITCICIFSPNITRQNIKLSLTDLIFISSTQT